jgi:Periplasmic binding protein
MPRDRQRLRGADDRALKGYAPLVVLVAAVIAMVAVVPSKVPGGAAAGPGKATEVADGQTASGWGTSVRPCPGQPKQVPGMSYSPPCFQFKGDNGGATSRGVSADTIKISYRTTADPPLLQLLGLAGGIDIGETNEKIAETAEALVEYFNKHLQFYGRKMEYVGYQGRGAVLSEFTGKGQDLATNDSIKVANEIGAFADASGLTQPYADALARNKVVSVGAPYMSQQWFQARRPYAWSTTPDCTAVSKVSAEYSNQRLLGRPAEWAGDGLKGKTRTLAVIAPDNLEYQQCVDSFAKGIAEAGHKIDLRLDYTLDVAALQGEAASLMSKLKAANMTSVSCACDPIMQAYLAQNANAQNYHPEWLIAGVGFIDLDLGGQIIAAQSGDQWNHAFGGSPLTEAPSPQTSEAYKAYQSVRPGKTPSLLVDQIYDQILTLALGIQMAGPDLTPDNFETGLFAFPKAPGQAGLWDWLPGTYTPVRDIREIWWDPDKVSPFNNKKGSWVDNGVRWEQGHIPAGNPEVFK